jgi:homeobox protein YOX1/YHP1
MSSSRDDRYYASSGKSRRTPPGDSEGVGFFQNFQGQGGRTVLPPISRAFPGLHFPGLFFYVVFNTSNPLNCLAHHI